MAGSHHFEQRLASPDAESARSGEDPHEHWRLTTSPDQGRKTGAGRSRGCGRADLPDLRLPGPSAAADLGGGLRLLRREAVAVRGGRARGLRLPAVPGDLGREAGSCPGGGKEVGRGPPPEAWCPLILVSWGWGSPRERSPPWPATTEALRANAGQ